MARLFKRYFSNSTLVAVTMISLTAVLVHGLAIPWLGYYYDDWSMLWSGAARGAASLVPMFSTDRPFMGILYSGFYRLIGNNIAGWHLAALLFRILGACAFYWILTLAWPRQKKSLYVLAGMVFVIFPGFLAEPNAATKINQLMGYSAALFSIAFTLKAARVASPRQRILWTVLAAGSLAFYALIYEYMIGLEVMRLALLFWIWWQGRPGAELDTARRVFRAYIPYIAVLFVFLIWRLFIFDSTRGPTNTGGLARSYLAQPITMTLRLLVQVVKDFFSASLFAWFVQAYQYLSSASFSGIALAALVAAVVALAALGYLALARRQAEGPDTDADADAEPRVMVITGALITLAAVFPVVFSDKALNLMDPYKAYALHPSAGVMILVLGLLLWLKPRYRTSVLVGLLVLSALTQTLNNQKWAEFWQAQKTFWWQVAWRAPDFKNNSLVMAYTPDAFLLQQEYESWGPLNLIYRQRSEPWPLIQSEILNLDTATELFKHSFLEPHVRDIYVPKYYSHFVLFSQPTTAACVRAIDGKMPLYAASERGIVEQAGRYSDLSFIETGSAAPTPPRAIFGTEPPHGWCYYYEKAELARQLGNWKGIAALYDQVTAAKLKAGDATEYLVYIEGLYNAGRAQDAAALVQSRITVQSAAHFAMCRSLAAAPNYPASFGYHAREIYVLTCENIDK